MLTPLTLLHALGSLALTLALLLGAVWAYQNLGPRLQLWLKQPGRARWQLPLPPPPRLVVKESRRLSPTTTLHLVALDNTEHLIAVTNAQTTVIHAQTAPASKPKPAKV